ncbi:aminoglycoside phosphotransferase family protein [Rathayibacter soli]|uniref:aminoglycoside phosphotransferase family protein n=1 Tax=Rathayibacter soli TaxID=3144168 RepID=UPI0027E459B7|nr:aminoglycoside phosphotransferase family protein [Glaciibacter superstes]
MHPAEIQIDACLVRALLAGQFPQWAALPLARFDSSGTVNAMFRLGGELAVRLPLIASGAASIEREAVWLPKLSRQLSGQMTGGRSLARIPRVLGVGSAGAGYPCPWLVVDWLPGASPGLGSEPGTDALARDLGAFVRALRRIDATDAPPGYRGGSLHPLDSAVRDCLRQVEDVVDSAGLLRLWEESLAAPQWAGAPVWTHGDLLAANILVADQRLSAVLDFGAAGIGDPACDAMAAWSVLPASARDVYRRAIAADDAMWLRGRGWALAQAAIALPYYRETNPGMTASSVHILTELMRG